MRTALVLSLLLSLLVMTFALMNGEAMAVDFGFAQTRGPIALVLLVTFALGVITGMLVMLSGRLRKRSRHAPPPSDPGVEPPATIDEGVA